MSFEFRSAAPSGDYSGQIFTQDIVFYIYSEMLAGNKIIAQDALNNLLSQIVYPQQNRPAICSDRHQKRIQTTTLLTRENSDLQNNVLGEIIWLYCQAKKHQYTLSTQWFPLIKQYVQILENDRFWEQEDFGFWGWERKIHISSIGICTHALSELKMTNRNVIRTKIINSGTEAIANHFNNHAGLDSSLLLLIWPFRVLPNHIATEVIVSIERNLLKSHGLIRFTNDLYYKVGEHPAQWSMPVPLLMLAKNTLGQTNPKNLYNMLEEINNHNFPETIIARHKFLSPNTPHFLTEIMCKIADNILSIERK